jgi:hypothetical protein
MYRQSFELLALLCGSGTHLATRRRKHRKKQGLTSFTSPYFLKRSAFLYMPLLQGLLQAKADLSDLIGNFKDRIVHTPFIFCAACAFLRLFL